MTKETRYCKHLVLGECSKTGENCKGLRACFEETEKENEKLKSVILEIEEYCKKDAYTFSNGTAYIDGTR